MSTVRADRFDSLRRRVRYWSARLRVMPSAIVILNMKNKWASCSRSGRIFLARDVAELPPRTRDYVIVHELMHLRVANHGRLFKAHLGAVMPDWRQRHEALGRHDRCHRLRAPGRKRE